MFKNVIAYQYQDFHQREVEDLILSVGPQTETQIMSLG